MAQQELAAKVGCSASLIYKIESDERRPSRQVAELLAQHLELPPEQRDLFLKIARQEKATDGLESLSPLSVPGPVLGSQLLRQPNLPLPLTSLIGREHELHAIIQQVQDSACRLLTLTGSGGIGKTRLALEAAHRLQETFEDGVYFVSLAGVSSPDHMISTIADAIGLKFSGPAKPEMQLLNYLHPKKLLLLLDNMEHLLEGVEVPREILQQTSEIKLIATSREPLHLQAEWIFEMQGLPVPKGDQVEELEASSAALLFLQRARQARMDFALTASDRTAILCICRLVEGMPLGLELAAAWVRTLSCPEIAQEIGRSIDFLASSARDLPERHRSITAVFDHSWKLLSAEEQQVMRHLSVFRGGFTREAAEAVAGTSLPVLSALVDKSLLRHKDVHVEGYDMHELVRQYAEAVLAQDAAEELGARNHHCRFLLTWLGSQEHLLKSAAQISATAAITANFDNIRAAWHWAAAQRDPSALIHAFRCLQWFMEIQNWHREAVSLFQRAMDALDVPDDSLARTAPEWRSALAQALQQLGYFRLRAGLGGSRPLLERSLAIAQSLSEASVLADAARDYGVLLYLTGDFENGTHHLRAALETYRDQNDRWAMGACYFHMGNAAKIQGRVEDAEQRFRESLEVVRITGNPLAITRILSFLSGVVYGRGAYPEAEQLAQEALVQARSIHDHFSEAEVLLTLALIAHVRQNHIQALDLLHNSLALFEACQDKWSMARVWNCIGQVHWDLGERPAAQEAFHSALATAHETQTVPQMLEALAGLAQGLAWEGEVQRALQIAMLVLSQPAATKDASTLAEQVRSALERQLPPNQMENIRLNAEHQTLELVVRETLER